MLASEARTMNTDLHCMVEKQGLDEEERKGNVDELGSSSLIDVRKLPVPSSQLV